MIADAQHTVPKIFEGNAAQFNSSVALAANLRTIYFVMGIKFSCLKVGNELPSNLTDFTS